MWQTVCQLERAFPRDACNSGKSTPAHRLPFPGAAVGRSCPGWPTGESDRGDRFTEVTICFRC